MKKSIISIMLFVGAFIVTYIGLGYLVPGLRIKLYAKPMVYFVESINHMVLFKGIISFIVGLGVGTIPVIIRKRKGK